MITIITHSLAFLAGAGALALLAYVFDGNPRTDKYQDEDSGC